MTRLSGAELLSTAERAVPTCAAEREDAVQDVALALVMADPPTLSNAEQIAATAYAAIRKRAQRRRADTPGHVLEFGNTDPHSLAEAREKLAVAVAWQRKHGRAPSRTTAWRLCRDLKQKPA